MKKIGTTDGGILVELSQTEFTALAGKSASGIPDGTSISLKTIKDALDLVDAKKSGLSSLKTAAQEMVQLLNSVGV